MLHDEDAAEGRNFVSDSARDLHALRRTQGWGVDPRTSSHMTSSQALMFNALAPLLCETGALTRFLRSVLPTADISRVLDVALEWAPSRRSRHLGDQTRVDVMIWAQASTGLAHGIVIEVKYSDRFNSRRVEVARNARYGELHKLTALWRLDRGVLERPDINQLLRVHALAESTMRDGQFGSTGPRLQPMTSMVLLRHSADASAKETFASYTDALEDGVVAACLTFESWFDAMQAAGCDEHVISALRVRYLDRACMTNSEG